VRPVAVCENVRVEKRIVARAEDLIGAEFDGYRIVRLIGRGGMGAVYEGLDVALGRRVAIKVLTESVNRNPGAVRRFQREAKAVASVSHPNIAQVYRVGKFGDLHYYAMEYVDGKSLEQMIAEEGRIAGRRCFDLMIQAVRGLKAAAEHGIIHRDVKPANLMVARDGTVKIVDFGIAKMIDDSDTFRTATGTIMGTPSYMSPEQCKGAPLDFRSDMYSLGCTFFELLTGRPPFEGETVYKVMASQIRAPTPAIPSIAPHVPGRLCNIIYTMMEKNPDNRYQSYDHLLTVLEAAREGRSAGLTATVVSETPPDERLAADRRRKLIYLAGGLVAVILIIAIAHFAGREQSPQKPPSEPAAEATSDDRPPGGLSKTVKTLRELDKFDRELRKEAREAY